MTIWQPSSNQVERLRLLLSTYQDGTGMLDTKKGQNLPGWRDFERSAALAFGGLPAESKALFDVEFPDDENPSAHVGLSCKMRGELDRVARDDRVTIEVSNSAGEFWSYLNTQGINQTNYKNYAAEVGAGLFHVVEQWHLASSVEHGGSVELRRSSYFVLQWSPKTLIYQLFQFSLEFPDPASISWLVPPPKREDKAVRRVVGNLPTGLLVEWYGESGGQLKYYPFASEAIWISAPFQLEPLPETAEYGILAKAAGYFPEQWSKVMDD